MPIISIAFYMVLIRIAIRRPSNYLFRGGATSDTERGNPQQHAMKPLQVHISQFTHNETSAYPDRPSTYKPDVELEHEWAQGLRRVICFRPFLRWSVHQRTFCGCKNLFLGTNVIVFSTLIINGFFGDCRPFMSRYTFLVCWSWLYVPQRYIRSVYTHTCI